ncbi:DUF7511 domain-containing protein [Natronolimnobius baerhuensis]|uniref:DUF7511 domain-containing protein n=1 Tax=Natronolimnobius baerhuensis TaxID=253108 RepID=A0A202E3I3_9EURY|nr:hypothetical protein [Natronolimnobius baerhuensis]OVE82856.1 hypothetical protein B2G88_18925 [Natronolimnobius baerhuensis]
MTGTSSGYHPDDVRHRETTTPQHSNQSITLEAIVVRYESRPDRCTILPRDCSEVEQLTTWLSADMDVFIDLEQIR